MNIKMRNISEIMYPLKPFIYTVRVKYSNDKEEVFRIESEDDFDNYVIFNNPNYLDIIKVHFLSVHDDELIEKLPKNIVLLTNLETLCCPYMSELKELDPEIFKKLIKLKYLDISNTKIETIPSTISFLGNLESLNCRKTQLKELPKEIGLLHNLKEIDCAWTNIKELPKEIGNLTKLEFILAIGTQLVEKSVPSDFHNHETLALIV